MSATTRDRDDAAGAIKTLTAGGQPPSGGTELLQVDAQQDSRIIGYIAGDVASTDKNLHQAIRCWIGGDDPKPNPSLPGSGYADDEAFIFEMGQTQESDEVNALGLADHTNYNVIFPDGMYIEWGEGETLNFLFQEFDNQNTDFMDCTIYYVTEHQAEAHGRLD